jgi:WD40 repeat protein
MKASLRTITLGCFVLVSAVQARAAAVPIPIARLERSEPVDFAKEILPILRANCLACHNQTRSKADLILETPQTILKGSENGPVIVAGHSDASLLLKVAAHETTPTMPPRDNKVSASDLTTEQLGLIKLWIDQGARGEAPRAEALAWQPLPEGYQPIYAVAINADDQTAACSRANRIFLYDLPTGRQLACLADPQLPAPGSEAASGYAHRDSIHALTFSPDGTLLASGGYREVKLWRKHKKAPSFQFAGGTNEITVAALSRDGQWFATGDPQGFILVRKIPTGKVVQTFRGYPSAIRRLEFSSDGSRLLAMSEDHVLRLWDLTAGRLWAELRMECDITAMTWLGEGEPFATASAEGWLQLWTTSRTEHAIVPGRKLHLRAGETLCLQPIAGCPEEIVSAGMDGVARIWDIDTGAVLAKFNHGAPIVALAVGAGRLASIGLDHSVGLWDLETHKNLARLRGDPEAQAQVARKEQALHFATNELAYSHQAFDTAEKERKTETDRVRKATEALSAAEKVTAEKQKKVDDARTAATAAEKPVTTLKTELAQAKETYTAHEEAVEEARQNLIACIQLGKDPAHRSAATRSSESEIAAELAASELQAKAHAAGEAKAQFERVTAEKRASLKPAEEKLAAVRKQLQEAETELKKVGQSQSNAENELTLAIAAAQKAAEHTIATQNAIPVAEAEVKRAQTDLASAEVIILESDHWLAPERGPPLPA